MSMCWRSNSAAIVIALIATLWKKGWWVDPVGGILISAAIIWRWILVTLEQVTTLTLCSVTCILSDRRPDEHCVGFQRNRFAWNVQRRSATLCCPGPDPENGCILPRRSLTCALEPSLILRHIFQRPPGSLGLDPSSRLCPRRCGRSWATSLRSSSRSASSSSPAPTTKNSRYEFFLVARRLIRPLPPRYASASFARSSYAAPPVGLNLDPGGHNNLTYTKCRLSGQRKLEDD